MAALSSRELSRIRRSRRSPRLTQFDYLHMRRLVDDLGRALGRLARPGDRVLDVWAGSRPYDDLLPATAEVVSLDVEGNPYGVADVVSDDFLPFPDASFDVVMCIQAFDFVPDPVVAVRELERVLRPHGAVLVSVPLVWEYDRAGPDRRYTGAQLAELFGDWEEVEVIENGGRAVIWTTLTASLAFSVQHRLARGYLAPVFRPLFAALYAAINLLGLVLDRLERGMATSSRVLPMNLLLTARRRELDVR
jgi:SAM-dependent methyltransferase